MGLYKASNLGDNVAKNARRRNASVEDPNSPKNLSRKGIVPETDEEFVPRKKLVDMTIEEQVDAAKDRILDIVSRVPRTTHEIREKLLSKGFKAQAVDKAIARMVEVNVLNDDSFAEQWAHSRFHYAGRSVYVITQELRRKGLSEDQIAAALEPIDSDSLQREKAEELASDKARSLMKTKPLLDAGDAKKIAAMLARRGFPAGLCFEVASSIVKSSGTDAEEVSL